jgi:hypothetical protein
MRRRMTWTGSPRGVVLALALSEAGMEAVVVASNATLYTVESSLSRLRFVLLDWGRGLEGEDAWDADADADAD